MIKEEKFIEVYLRAQLTQYRTRLSLEGWHINIENNLKLNFLNKGRTIEVNKGLQASGNCKTQ
jgi:hypothetical protein